MSEEKNPRTTPVKMRVTNMGVGSKGVNLVDPNTGAHAGTKLLAPGQSAVVYTSEAEMGGVSEISFEPPDAEQEGKAPSDEDTLNQMEKLEEMSDDELHNALEQADGRRRPANTSRQTLIDQALELGLPKQ